MLEKYLRFDLTKFSDTLTEPEKDKKLKGLIKSYQDANIGKIDIVRCIENLDALDSLNPNKTPESDHEETIISALLDHAIVLYARATKTQSDHRGTLTLHSKMPPEMQVVHEEITGIRDGAIAHWGPGNLSNGKRLASSCAVLAVNRNFLKNEASISAEFHWTFSIYQDNLAKELKVLAEFCLQEVNDLINKRKRKLLVYLDEYSISDNFKKNISQHEFNQEEFYGNSHGNKFHTTYDVSPRIYSNQTKDEISDDSR